MTIILHKVMYEYLSQFHEEMIKEIIPLQKYEV